MKYIEFTLFVAILCVLSSFSFVDCLSKFKSKKYFKFTPPTDKTLPDEQWYDQRLDHFDESNTAIWKQRFWVNDTFFQNAAGKGPVFIMIGGEGEENPIWMVEGAWIRYAEIYGALCVLLEHRFYGKSRPTDDISTENLSYLSSEQALADLAGFRQFIAAKYNLTDDNKWISFGGSYPGSLSAWFRLKYPHLVHGAIASSAPMYAVIDFSDYLVVVNNSLNIFSPTCSKYVSDATVQIQNLMSTSSGRKTLQTIFKTCDPIVSDDDVTNFYATVAGNFEGVVQYNLDNRAFEGAVDTNVTIEVLCNIMSNTQIGDALSRYVAVNQLILETYSQSCLDISYNKSIDELKQTAWNSSASVGGRQWFWQTCVEFGFFQSSDSKNQPFGQTFPVDFFTKQCQQVFGPSFNYNLLVDSVDNTNTNYGGYNYEGSRVLFVNGEVDPWHALGFYQEPPNPYVEVLFIKRTAHCADMYPSSHFDPIQLEEAREYIISLIGLWLQQD